MSQCLDWRVVTLAIFTSHVIYDTSYTRCCARPKTVGSCYHRGANLNEIEIGYDVYVSCPYLASVGQRKNVTCCLIGVQYLKLVSHLIIYQQVVNCSLVECLCHYVLYIRLYTTVL